MTQAPADAPPSPDPAVAQGGAYAVLRARLAAQGARLRELADGLNTRRLAEFGDSRLKVLGRLRIQTEHSALGRDIVQVGEKLLFGFNIFLGLKTQTRVEDVFGLYRLTHGDGEGDVQPVAFAGTFLADPAFVRDFEELYAYYKGARLLQLAVQGERLLAAFQIGERESDRRVFRWALSPAGEATYLDARGERDLTPPAPFDFSWTRAGRDQEVSGRFPHLNILDTLFVETNGGDLTVKIENNTETGQGIYSEPVEDVTQTIDDATFEYARVGELILLRVRPYREGAWRGLIYNTLTRTVRRCDAVAQACVGLPEDHGILFPGGYELQGGEHRAFDAAMDGMHLGGTVRSPNGEDVLYLYYEPVGGRTALFVYNLIRRELHPPIFAHGHARLPDGRMVLFQAESGEPTRIHPLQVWQTPFASEIHAAARPPGTSDLGRLGNAELVRGLSNLYDLAKDTQKPGETAERSGALTARARRLFDLHPWFAGGPVPGLDTLLREITATGEAVQDEFEKVAALRGEAARVLAEVTAETRTLLGRLRPDDWAALPEFVDALNALGTLRGRLLAERERREIDVGALDALGAEVQDAQARLGAATGAFLAGEAALAPFAGRLDDFEAAVGAAATAREVADVLAGLAALGADLDLLSELLGRLPADDAAARTRVVAAISALYARLNGARARAEGVRDTLGSAELVSQFGAQFRLYTQSVTAALALATTPERADEGLSRSLVALEELEGQFGEHARFLPDLLTKREEVHSAFEARRQALQDERERRALALLEAARRILGGLAGRGARLDTPEALHAFFAGDGLILKLRDLAAKLRDLKDPVKADEIDARLSAARDEAVRALRDRRDLYEDGGSALRLGRHRFSVNTQPLDLTLLPQDGTMTVHLTGTAYREALDHPALNGLRAFWGATLASESPELARAEYLAGEVLRAAEGGEGGLSLPVLRALDPAALERAVRDFSAPRYQEGYEKGVHDHDAARILGALLPLLEAAGPLVHPPAARAGAALYWAQVDGDARAAWGRRLASAHALHGLFGRADALNEAKTALANELQAFLSGARLPLSETDATGGAAFLADELRTPEPTLTFTAAAAELNAALDARLEGAGLSDTFTAALSGLSDDLAGRWALVTHALSALTGTPEHAPHARLVPEAAALRLVAGRVAVALRPGALDTTVDGLLGQHPRIVGGTLRVSPDDFLARLSAHRRDFVPAFGRYQALRHEVIAAERKALRLEDVQARPLSTFVRGRLVNDVYLPLVGDNFAKQLGTLGEGGQSDRLGLLLLISPPGYGKTTLLEYVAHRLGLVFVKVSGPSLGHGVRSLDPAGAPDAAARQELEKLGLALEMGQNVMLYVDDIQHTHPEFLQKFISLTDATRRIEGVWRGQPRTYDLRGRRFAVVMAGNPYTESGEVFKVPDMLANRADVYNLGDVLGGLEDAFLQSYIENSLGAHPLLRPLATRDLADLTVLLARAGGEDASSGDLKHPYSPAELAEIVALLERLLKVRAVLWRVNAQYITSAAQDDRYRTEPPFRLQGSYRNMTRLAARVSPVMNDAELDALLTDHYQGEAQLLTGGAEENLLKLAELRGTLTPQQAARWDAIKADFRRNRAMGGDEHDTGARMVAQLADIAQGLSGLANVRPPAPATPAEPLADALRGSLGPVLAEIARGVQQRPEALPAAPAPDGLPALEAALSPLLAALADSAQRQDGVNAALHDLVNLIRSRQAAQRSVQSTVGATGRHEGGE